MLDHPSSPEAPALHPDGTLKDASEITWYNSPSDATPITVGMSMVCTTKNFSLLVLLIS